MKKIVVTIVVVLILGGAAFWYFKDNRKDKNNSGQPATENQKTEEETKSDLPEASIGNPASIHCVENGGKSEIRNDQFGEVGYCVFDDSSECEEWAFYQGECQKGQKKNKANEE